MPTPFDGIQAAAADGRLPEAAVPIYENLVKAGLFEDVRPRATPAGVLSNVVQSIGQPIKGVYDAGARLPIIGKGLEIAGKLLPTETVANAIDYADEKLLGHKHGREEAAKLPAVQVANAVAQAPAYIAAGIVNPALPFAMGAAGGVDQGLSAADEFEKATGKELTSTQRALVGSAGLAAGSLEGLPFERLLGAAGGAATKRISNAALKRVLDFVVKAGETRVGNALGQGAVEAGQNVVSQVAQNAAAKEIYNPDQDVMEGVDVASQTPGALAGAVIGAALPGGHVRARINEPAPKPQPNSPEERDASRSSLLLADTPEESASRVQQYQQKLDETDDPEVRKTYEQLIKHTEILEQHPERIQKIQEGIDQAVKDGDSAAAAALARTQKKLVGELDTAKKALHETAEAESPTNEYREALKTETDPEIREKLEARAKHTEALDLANRRIEDLTVKAEEARNQGRDAVADDIEELIKKHQKAAETAKKGLLTKKDKEKEKESRTLPEAAETRDTVEKEGGFTDTTPAEEELRLSKLRKEADALEAEGDLGGAAKIRRDLLKEEPTEPEQVGPPEYNGQPRVPFNDPEGEQISPALDSLNQVGADLSRPSEEEGRNPTGDTDPTDRLSGMMDNLPEPDEPVTPAQPVRTGMREQLAGIGGNTELDRVRRNKEKEADRRAEESAQERTQDTLNEYSPLGENDTDFEDGVPHASRPYSGLEYSATGILKDMPKEQTGSEAIKSIAKSPLGKSLNVLLNRIHKYVKDMKVSYVNNIDVHKMAFAGDDPERQAAAVLKSGADGVYVPANAQIYVHRAKGDHRTMAHELVHGATELAIRDPANAHIAVAIKNLRNAVINKGIPKLVEQGKITSREATDFADIVSDEHEMITYGMTSPNFRKVLDQLTPTGNVHSGKGETAFIKFKAYIKKALGLNNPTAAKALDEMFDKILERNEKYLAEGKNTAGPRPHISPTAPREEAVHPTEDTEHPGFDKAISYVTSKSDRWQDNNNPVLRRISHAVREFVTYKARNHGEFNKALKPALDILKAARSSGRFKGINQEFNKYQQMKMDKSPGLKEHVDSMGEDTVAVLHSVNAALKVAAERNKASGAKVFDPKTGKYRPFSALDEYFPLIMKPEYRRAIRDPLNPKNAKYFRQIADHLKEKENVKKWARDNGFKNVKEGDKYVASDEAVRSYLKRNDVSGGANSSTEGFFGNVEVSRTDPLPSFAYDMSLNAVKEYRERWADRIAQIEAFGQGIGKDKSLFDKALDEKGVSLTEEQLKEVETLARRLNHTTDRIKQPDLTYGERLQNLGSTVATGFQLSALTSAVRNLVGGNTLTAATFGPVELAKAYAKLMADPKSVSDRAFNRGITRDLVMGMLYDPRLAGDHSTDWLSKTQHGANTMTTKTLHWGQFANAEDHVRSIAMLVGESKLAEGIKTLKESPDSLAAKKFKEFCKRNGVDHEKLLNGSEAEADKFIQRVVNLTQGSYELDQVPLWADSPWSKFYFKYYKFTLQATRLFLREHIEPMIKSKDPKIRADAAYRTARYIAVSALGGWLGEEAIATIFGTIFDDHKEEIKKAFEDKKTSNYVAQLALAAWTGLMKSGTLGLFGKVGDTGLDFAKALETNGTDPAQAQSVLIPPGLDPVVDFGKMILSIGQQYDHLKNQPADIGNIVWDYLKHGIGLIGSTTKLANSAAMGSTDSSATAKGETQRREVQDKMVNFLTEESNKGDYKFPDRDPLDVTSILLGWSPHNNAYTITNRKIKDALLRGDGKEARKLADQLIADQGGDEDKEDRAEKSTNGAVERLDPFYIPGKDVDTDEMQKKFIVWAQRNLPKEKVAQMLEAKKKYDKAVEEAGF